MLVKTLLSAIRLLAPIIPKEPIHKILGCVRLQAKGGNLTVTGSNLINILSVTIPCDAEFDFDCAIAQSRLDNFLATCSSDGYLELCCGSGDDAIEQMHFKSTVRNYHRFHYKLNTLPVSEFPATEELERDGVFEVICDRGFAEALASAVKMASTDPKKEVLNGVYVKVFDGLATVRATDGCVMSEQVVNVIGDDCEFVVNSDLIKLLLKTKKEANLQLKIGTEALRVTVEGVEVFSRLVVGDYPSFEKIKHPTSDKVVVDVRSLKAAINRCCAPKEKGNDTAHLIWVYGDFKEQCLWVEGGKGKEKVAASVGRDPDASYVEAKLLLKALKGVETVNVALQLGREAITRIDAVGETVRQATFGLAGRETAVKPPYQQTAEGTVVVTAKMTWKDDNGVDQTMEPAIALPYHYEPELGLIVDQDFQGSWWKEESRQLERIEFKCAMSLPYQHIDGCLVVTQALEKDYWEYKNGTGRWISCKFAPAEALPLSTQEEETAMKPPIWHKLKGIRLPLLGDYWNKHWQCDRQWTDSQLETLQSFLLDWVKIGNEADSVRELLEKFVKEADQGEICNRLGFDRLRTDLLLRYTTAPASFDGFGTQEIASLFNSKRGLPWRKVLIQPENLQWQEGRYGSGMHPSFTQEEWDKINRSEEINQQTAQIADAKTTTGEQTMATKLTLAAVQADAATYNVEIKKTGSYYLLYTLDGDPIAYAGHSPAQFRNLRDIMTALPRLDSQEVEVLEDDDGIDSTDIDTDDIDSEGADNTDSKGADDIDSEGADNTDSEGADNTDSEGADNTDIEGADNTGIEGADNTDIEGADIDRGELATLPQQRPFTFVEAAQNAIASLPPMQDGNREFSVIAAAKERLTQLAAVVEANEAKQPEVAATTAIATATNPSPPSAPAKSAPAKSAPAKSAPAKSASGGKVKKLVNYPAQDTLTPVQGGSKTAKMIDLLFRSQGVTMAELLQQINPNETSVRVYFGYDLKRKGYGVKEDADGNFYLVLPDGVDKPLAHTTKAK